MKTRTWVLAAWAAGWATSCIESAGPPTDDPQGGTHGGALNGAGGAAEAGGTAPRGGVPAGGGVETGGVETGGVETGGAETGGAETGGAETGGVETGGVETGGVETGGVETGGAETGGACDVACELLVTCAAAACAGLTGADEPALQADCAARCDEAFAAALSGLSCGEAVPFARLSVPALEMLCPERRVPPPDGTPCPFDCVDGERCVEGRCVRRDGTCETDYHCVVGTERCVEGWCRPAEFAPCQADAACDRDTQTCRRWDGNGGPGYCMLDCARDGDCPLHHRCMDDGQRAPYCYYVPCGGATHNGEPFGACAMDQAGGRGVCSPLAEGDRQPDGSTGVCVEGGPLADGDACDAQAQDRAHQCPAGSFCFGDPDAPLSPVAGGPGRGRCAALCDPHGGRCARGDCVDFSTVDEPRTPGYDETLSMGLCLDTECSALAPAGACGEGRACRVFALTDARGRCELAGQTPAGGPCETDADCAPDTICGQDGALGMRCLALCSAETPACGPRQTCWRDPSWPLGVCLTR